MTIKRVWHFDGWGLTVFRHPLNGKTDLYIDLRNELNLDDCSYLLISHFVSERSPRTQYTVCM